MIILISCKHLLLFVLLIFVFIFCMSWNWCLCKVMLFRLFLLFPGTFLYISRTDDYPDDRFMCLLSLTALRVSVYVEWAFLFFGIVCPLLFYVILYCKAGRQSGMTWRCLKSKDVSADSWNVGQYSFCVMFLRLYCSLLNETPSVWFDHTFNSDFVM